MDRIIRSTLRHRRLFPWIAAVLILASVILIPTVAINYDLRRYLPADSDTRSASGKMDEVYGISATASVMTGSTTLPDALALKARLAAVPGVQSVTFLDDVTDPLRPVDLESETVRQFWRDGHALFQIVFDASEYDNATHEALAGLREAAGPEAAIAGPAARTATMITSVGKEVGLIMLFVVPAFLLILLALTHSVVEAVLFMVVTGVAVLLNMATNLLFPDISFMTHMSAGVLQLAVSMDYSIFLLHRFNEERELGPTPEEAMVRAVRSSLPTIAASALTTTVGFLALIFMRYSLGRDIGLVLTKGILLSLVSVVFLLPGLALLFLRGIDKTSHRALLPSFRLFGGAVLKIRWAMVAVWAGVAVIAFLAQGSNAFSYSESAILSGKGSRVGADAAAIEATFGRNNPLVILLPDPGPAGESSLAREIDALPSVLAIQSPATLADPLLPRSVLPAALTEQFLQGGWLRMIVTLDTTEEVPEAFVAADAIREVVDRHTGGQGMLLGATTGVQEIRTVVEYDYTIVTLVSIAAVMLILFFAFRSAILPLLLVLVIESAVWINMAVPYFTSTSLGFIGYLIVGAIQLGATIDYAILLTGRYVESRTAMPAKEALREAIQLSGGSILTSAGILTAAGIIVSLVSKIAGIREIGLLIGRGAAISALLVLSVLPALLVLLDRPIVATTLKLRKHAYHPSHERKSSP